MGPSLSICRAASISSGVEPITNSPAEISRITDPSFGFVHVSGQPLQAEWGGREFRVVMPDSALRVLHCAIHTPLGHISPPRSQFSGRICRQPSTRAQQLDEVLSDVL